MTIERNPNEGKGCFNKIPLEFLFGRTLQSWVTLHSMQEWKKQWRAKIFQVKLQKMRVETWCLCINLELLGVYFLRKQNFSEIWKKIIHGGQDLRPPPQIDCPPEVQLFLVKIEDCPPNGGHLVTLRDNIKGKSPTNESKIFLAFFLKNLKIWGLTGPKIFFLYKSFC